MSNDLNPFIANSSIKTLQGPPRFAHKILWTATLFMIIAFIWSKFAILDEVTTGKGKVIPSRQIQVIQNLEGGILEEVLVKEGQLVEKDQILMKIDDTRFSATYKESEKKIAALTFKVARLRSELEGIPFVVPQELKNHNTDLFNQEEALLLSRQSELTQLKSELALAEKEYKITKPLVKKGAASEVELLRLERTNNESSGKIHNFKSSALQDLNETKAQLSALTEASVADKDRLNRTIVKSPLKGIIKKIKIMTLGGVIQPGSDMLELVPYDDTLLIEAKVRPADIGFLRPGQDAKVKITAFDFSIYGGLSGRVERISADTITEETRQKPEDESYYLVYVRTQQNFLESKGKKLYIIPGMLASVDVLTGQKSVLDYLLKPIIKAKDTALRER